MIEKATLEEMVQDLSQRVSRLESGVVHNYGPIEAKPATVPITPSCWPVPNVDPVCNPGGCAKIGCDGGYYCRARTMVPVGSGATLAKVFGHGGPFGEDGALLAVGYSENQ